MFIFFIGSLAASLAQSAAQLIAFRAITGVGGGGLMTLAQTIVSDVVTLRERSVFEIFTLQVSCFADSSLMIAEANTRESWYGCATIDCHIPTDTLYRELSWHFPMESDPSLALL